MKSILLKEGFKTLRLYPELLQSGSNWFESSLFWLTLKLKCFVCIKAAFVFFFIASHKNTNKKVSFNKYQK